MIYNIIKGGKQNGLEQNGDKKWNAIYKHLQRNI